MQQAQIFEDPNTLKQVLLGDVGGTNVRLQLVQIKRDQTSYSNAKIIKENKYHTSDFAKFVEFISKFLKDVDKSNYPHFAVIVIAIAACVKDNTVCAMANTKWPTSDGFDIGKQLKIEPFIFINDFQAVAYGVLGLKDDDVTLINKVKPTQNKVKTVCGPGTGMGTCMLYPAKVGGDYQYQVMPAEGGHSLFSPTNQLEMEFLTYLEKELKREQIIAEAAFCGPAIPFIYTFFRNKNPDYDSVIEKELGKEQFDLEKYKQSKDKKFPNKEILVHGLEKKDEVCSKCVEFQLGMLQNFVGDLICFTLPLSGIYLIGSIISSYRNVLKELDFMKTYREQRGYMKESVFDRVPIYVINKGELGLEGSYQASLRVLEMNDRNVYDKL